MASNTGAARVLKLVGLLVLATVAGVLSYLALTQSDETTGDLAVDQAASSTPSPSASTTETPTADPGAPTAQDVPPVKDQRRKDFAAGDELPDGGRLVDVGDNETGMALGEAGLTHGSPGETGGSGYLETRLKADVQSLGARVTFAADKPGSIALVAWQTSLADAVGDGEEPLELPATGLRFVASPGAWELSVVDETGQEDRLANGTYNALAGETVSFQVTRGEDAVYVIDPTGTITQAVSPLVSRLAGPWASWGLVEASGENPAVIESVWAG